MDERKELDQFDVTELDNQALEGVAGGGDVLSEDGGTNGNCKSCLPGDPVPAGDWTNGNC